MPKQDLVEIIKANPGCLAIIDNDMWSLYRRPPAGFDDLDDDEKYDWYEKKGNLLVHSDSDFKKLGDGGYGSGNCYGGDILQALAIIVGIKIESV